MVVFTQSQSESLASDVVLQEAITLDAQVFNGFIHSLYPVLGRSYGSLVFHDLVYKVFLQHILELLLSVDLLKLPLTEVPMEWVIHRVYAVFGPLLHKTSLLHPAFPLVQSFWYDFEVAVSEKHANYSAMHLLLLFLLLLGQIALDVFL